MFSSSLVFAMLSVMLKVSWTLGVGWGVEPGGTGSWQKEGSSLET